MIDLETEFVPKRRIASVSVSKNNSRANSIKICSEKDIEDLKLEVTDAVFENGEENSEVDSSKESSKFNREDKNSYK